MFNSARAANWLSLRQLLTIPYVVLVLAAVLVIGTLSYTTGKGAVDTLSDYALRETAGRISQAISLHLANSRAVLETAFPAGMAAPASVEKDIASLRTRFWLATSLHRDVHNYAYYGDRAGHFFGLWRYSASEAELRLRTESNRPRKIYHFSGIMGALQKPKTEERVFDPRERPWYKAGQAAQAGTWTSIYIDFKSLELVGTRARRVDNAVGEFQGVVATDLSLKDLSTFLRQLKLSPNGLAFIVEADCNLIATSRGSHLKKGPGENNLRLNAADATADIMLGSTWRAVRELMSKPDSSSNPQTAFFAGPGGEPVQVAYARVGDDAGLDWIVAVAVPRADFLGGIEANVKRTIAIALAASLGIVLVGYLVLHSVAGDLKRLALAAEDVVDGRLNREINTDRQDEIGQLARTFAQMQERLLTDRLTGLGNREALTRRVEEKILLRRRTVDARPFALLFLDLNGFKDVNDTHGHDAGDALLALVGERMRSAVRAGDFVARFGGDEFAILLDSIDSRAAVDSVCRTLGAKLCEPYGLADGTRISVGASVGCAICPDNGRDLEALFKCADEDMYRQKQARHTK
jgi:diguanylate cyclase (GGDEF)-like protein